MRSIVTVRLLRALARMDRLGYLQSWFRPLCRLQEIGFDLSRKDALSWAERGSKHGSGR
jgi:hypothetical protein